MKPLLTLKKKNQFTKQPAKFYQRLIAIVVTFYVLLFLSHVIFPNESKYLTVATGEVITGEGSPPFKVVHRYYDKQSNRYQLILWLTTEHSSKDDYELELKAKSVMKSNANDVIEGDVTRIGRNYFSIVIPDVTDDYEALRTDLTITRSTINMQQSSEPVEVKLYSDQTQTEEKSIDITPSFFGKQERDIHVGELNSRCKELEKANTLLEKEIEAIGKLQEKIRVDMRIQVADEREESQRTIDSYQTELKNKENKIEENNQEIEDLQAKIKLIKG